MKQQQGRRLVRSAQTARQYPMVLVALLVIGFGSFFIVEAQAHDFGGPSTGGTPFEPNPPPPCEEPPCQCPDPTSGNPILFLDGSERLSYSDLVVRGVYPIRLTRRYNSQAYYDSPLGYGWAFDHDRRLFEYPDGSAIVRSSCGVRNKFVFTGGAFAPDRDTLNADLTEHPDGTFELFYPSNGNRDFFDAEGRLIIEQNARGQQHEFLYDSRGKLPLTGTSPFAVNPDQPMTVAYVYRITRIQERDKSGVLTGVYVDFTYDETTGRLTQITASDGRVVSYQHDSFAGLTRGNLIQVTGLENIVQTFAYNDPNDAHNVTSIQDHASANPVVNTYDTQDRVISQTYGNHQTDFDYVIDRGKTVVTETIVDENGLNPYTTTTTYEFDEAGYFTLMKDALGNETRHLFDANKDRIRTEIWQNDAGVLNLLQATDFTYDGYSRKTSEAVTLDSGETITTTWTYDNGWVASEETVASAAPTRIFRTEYTFHRNGSGIPTNIASMKRRKDDGSFQTTSYVYDTQGRLTETTLADGVQIINEYTGAYVTRTYFKDAAGTVLPELERRFGYDALGNRIQQWDARDNLTQYAHDDRLRLIQVTNPLGEETHYTYAGPHLTQIEVGRTTLDGEGQITKFLYDGKDRRVEIQRKHEDGTFKIHQTFAYDSQGNLLQQTDALSRSTTFAYDLLGRLQSVTDPESHTTQFAYDAAGNRSQITDALSRVTQYAYDDLNRLIEEQQQGITPAAITSYSYDAVGNLLSVTDPESNTTSYSYDTLSRRTQETRPLGQTLTYVYDNRDRIDHTLNARNQRVEYDYAPWGPVITERHYLDSQGLTLDRTLTYAYNEDGQLTATTDDSLASGDLYTTGYDALGRPDIYTAKYLPGGDKTLTYTYDRYGNQDGVTLNDGSNHVHSYSYDKRNRLTAATLPGSQAFTLTYTEADERQQIDYPNGATTSYSYQPAGPIDTITTKNSGGITLESWDYSYNNVHNITQITTTDGNNDYGYDGLNRLTSAVFPPGLGLTNESYDYDQVGNREDPVDPLLYDYDANNRIQSSPGKTYTFDADGNQTATSAGETFTYDVINRLRNYSKPGTTAEYDYDPAGRRIRKTVNTTDTTWFLWDGTQLIAEYDGAGNRQQRYAYLPGDYAPSQTEDANGTYNVHSDHLQTPKLMTDTTEVIVWINHMQAFGESVLNEDPDGDLTAVTLNVRFPGQYEDQESRLYYNYLRDYSHIIGRYIERDPLGYPDGPNTFLYARINPMTFIDPKGLRLLGTVACSGGQWAIFNDAADTCIGHCVEKHERVHLNFLIQIFGSDACQGVPDGGLPGGEKYSEQIREANAQSTHIECKALQVSNACLEPLTKDECDPKCKQLAEATLEGSKANARSLGCWWAD